MNGLCPALAASLCLPLLACDVEPLSAQEERLIYGQMVDRISQELTAEPAGSVSKSSPCPLGGTWSMEGNVVGSGVDRGWDVVTKASGCHTKSIALDGTEAELEIDSDGVSVFSPQPGDETPFSAKGTVGWKRVAGSGDGTCGIVEPDGCK